MIGWKFNITSINWINLSKIIVGKFRENSRFRVDRPKYFYCFGSFSFFKFGIQLYPFISCLLSEQKHFGILNSGINNSCQWIYHFNKLFCAKPLLHFFRFSKNSSWNFLIIMGKNNKVYLLPPRGRNSTKLTSPKYAFDSANDRFAFDWFFTDFYFYFNFRTDPTNSFTAPEHVDLPEISDENELLYELQTIVIFVIAMSTQYLNIFRTYWWMPETYRRYAMVP